MVVLYYIMYMRPKPKPVVNQRRRVSAVKRITPTVTLEPTQPASISATLLATLKVHINASTANSANAQKIRSALLENGIKSVTIQPTAQTSAKTLVLFSPDIPDSLRLQCLTEIQKHYPTASSQESTQQAAAISITLGVQ